MQNKLKLSICKTCYNLQRLGKALTSNLQIEFTPMASHIIFEELLFLVITMYLDAGLPNS